MARERKFNRPRGINCRANRHKRYMLRYKNLINRSTVTSVTGSVTLPKSDKPDINMQNGQDAMDQMSRSPSVTVSGIWRSISTSSGLTLRLVRSCDAQSVRPRDGYRLIHLDKLHVIDVTVHCIICPPCKDLVTAGGLPIKFVGEVYRVDLASVVEVECLGCGKDFIMKTSDEITLGEGSKKVYDVNARAVWGQMSTGGGHSKLEEFSATLGMPCMTARTFSNLEMTIGESWINILHNGWNWLGAPGYTPGQPNHVCGQWAGNRSGVFNQVKFGWTDILPLPEDYYIIAQIIIVHKSVYFYKTCYKYIFNKNGE